MHDPGKPRKRGKRGGSARQHAKTKDIHSKVNGVHRLRPNANTPTGALLEHCGRFFSVNQCDETLDDHIVPRKSVTVKQMLKIVTRPETVTMHARQLDQKDFDGTAYKTSDEAIAASRMIETTDQRVIYRTERSLLIEGTPGSKIGTFKRDGVIRNGAISQRVRETITEIQPSDEIIGPAVNADVPDKI